MEETIHFEDMPVFQNQIKTQVDSTTKKEQYTSLYKELLAKCDPQNFISRDPYDAFAVDAANQLYSKLLEHKKDWDVSELKSPKELKKMRDEAQSKLGITISPSRYFLALSKLCHPKQFVGSNYDSQILEEANHIYAELIQKEGDIEALEIYEPIVMQFASRTREIAKKEASARAIIENRKKNIQFIVLIISIAFFCLLIIALLEIFVDGF